MKDIDIDKDLQQRLQRFAEGISPEPGRSAVVVRSARRKRRLVALSAGLAVVVVVGGLAGATTLLGDRDGIRPAPGPEEASGCHQPDFDIAMLVSRGATKAEVAEAGAQLEADPRVAGLAFVGGGELRSSSGDATLPPHSEDRYLVDLAPGTNPDEDVLGDLDIMGAGAYVLRHECDRGGLARYFFEVEEGNSSASGILEVNWANETICLEVQTRNVDAARLVLQLPRVFPKHVDADASSPQVLFTFFDTNDGSGSQLAPSGTHCFRHEQFGSRQSALDLLRRGTPGFILTFHRGPEDEPGLVAELVPQGGEERVHEVESFAAALFKDDELEDAVPDGFSLREIIRHGPDDTNHDYATVGVQMDGPVLYARVIFFVHPTERDAAEMAIRRSELLSLDWKAQRDGDEGLKPFAVTNALPGSTCGSEPHLVTCHASLGRVMVLTQSTAGAGDAAISDEEVEAATALIRSFGGYLERIYPSQERRFGDVDGFVGLLEDSAEAQGGTIRLQVIPESIGRGRIAEIVLINETESLVFYGHYYELEKQALRGWTHVRRPDTCVFTQELISLAPGDDVRHPIGPYSSDCDILPLRHGNYRVTKDVELESGDRLPLMVTFSIAPAADDGSVGKIVRNFMQRRVAGVGAEKLLDRRGRAEFGPGGDLAPLYPDPPLQNFQIEFVDDLGNESYEVGVSLVFQQGSYGETLFVRERNGQLVISGGRPGVQGP